MERVTLYTRPGCGLCDEMKADLLKRGYVVREVNIDLDPVLVAKYGWSVPVVVRDDGSILASGSPRLPNA